MDLCLHVKNTLLRSGQFLNDTPGVITLEMLEEFLTILSNEPVCFLDENVKKMAKSVSHDGSLWPLLITKSKLSNITSMATQIAKSSVTDPENRRYFLTWMEIRKFLDNLGPVYTKAKPWSQIREKFPALSGPSFKASIMTGRLGKTVYSTAGSSTGRMTVKKGPNFLIAPAEARHALTPHNMGSDLVIIDFLSMEPRTVLAAANRGDQCTNDIYEMIMNLCGISDRATAKLATISALYGASAARLIETVGSRSRATKIIERVREVFAVTDLENHLEFQAEDSVVRNFFGRPLHNATKNPRIRVNHYAQSTAAELAALLFRDLCDSLPTLTPLLVIHDALIAEIPKSDFEKLSGCLDELSFEGVKFPTSVKVL